MRQPFGNVTLDAATRQLWRDGQEVHLSPKAFDLLALLIARRPGVVSKADIGAALWPDTFVSDTNLPALVAEIRSALGDDARTPRFVRTAHRVGYAFLADPSPGAGAIGPGAWLVADDTRVPLYAGETVLGREGAGVTVLDSGTVSRRHAMVTLDGRGASIADLGSKNGTWVNECRVTGPAPLADGNRVRIGSLQFTFRTARAGVSTDTVTSHGGGTAG